MARKHDNSAQNTISMHDPYRFFNREFSWLVFNQRILAEVANLKNPLLERVRFLSISAANLDEFLMVRLAGLIAQMVNQPSILSDDGLTPQQQVELLLPKLRALQRQQSQFWEELQTALFQENIKVLSITEIEEDEKIVLEKYFQETIFPTLTPIFMQTEHELASVANLGLSLFIYLRNVETGEEKNVLMRLPTSLPRFIFLSSQRLVALETVIFLFLSSFFSQYRVSYAGLFRVVRDSDIDLKDEEESDDLFSQFESALKQRRYGRVIQIEFCKQMPQKMRDMIQKGLNVSDQYIRLVTGFLGLNFLDQLLQSPREDLKFPSFTPKNVKQLQRHYGDCFATIAEKDLLVHHPYETFDVVVQFLRAAAEDPNVLVIKQTLYRTSNDSPIVQALIDAAQAGKAVVALVELKARFDEAANLRWARDLEQAGVQVIFSFFDLKIHAKMSLVVRKEGEQTRSYVHVGTGNYHPITAKTYTDFSFFTCDPVLAYDISLVFNYITSDVAPQKDMEVALSPLTLRSRILHHINDEILAAKQGKKSGVWMKMNALVDAEIIDALYRASQNGVPIHLIVRGICCLKPGIIGLSENIYVKSIVGRFLEHSRIYCFAGGESLPSSQAIVYISSADMMPRNLDKRVELLVPIKDAIVHQRILSQIMVANMMDNQQSFEILPSGSFRRLSAENEQLAFSAQNYFMLKEGEEGETFPLCYQRPKTVIVAQDYDDIFSRESRKFDE